MINLMESIKGKVIDVRSGTVDINPEHIIDGYIKFQIEEKLVWCFIGYWRNYFPYNLPYSRFGVGKELVKNLLGQIFDIQVHFTTVQSAKLNFKEKKIIPEPNQKKPCDYHIFGEIISKLPHPKWPEQVDKLIIDCGLILEVNADKGQYTEGEYIFMEGRMDAIILDFEKNAIKP